MAREMQRGRPRYWVQTPNFWFPIEPHFLVPAWHWLPEDARVAILRRRGVGWAGRCPGPDHARRVVQEHRLMRRDELARLFPDAQRIVGERFGGLTKSWTAIRGFPKLPAIYLSPSRPRGPRRVQALRSGRDVLSSTRPRTGPVRKRVLVRSRAGPASRRSRCSSRA